MPQSSLYIPPEIAWGIPPEAGYTDTPPPGFDSEVAYLLATFCSITYNDYEGKPLDLPSGFSVLGKFYYANKITGTQVPIGLVLGSTNTIVLAFRGTVSYLEWLVDGSFMPVYPTWANTYWLVHSGFNTLYSVIRSAVFQILNAQAFAGKNFYITGHSLGGALATLAMIDVQVNYSALPVPKAYTFGSPRVGTFLQLARNYDSNIGERTYRVGRYYGSGTLPADIVTTVPTLPYYHVDQLYPLLGTPPNDDAPFHHSIIGYMELLAP